jgi:large subunit ribosomal protein L5
MSRISELYTKQVVPALMEEFKYSSPMQVPKLVKVVLNCGVGEATANGKAMDYVVYALTQISGQKPMVTRSRKAIATFKLKENAAIGCMVTLRNKRMFDFVDRLISIALPRVRDFRGTPETGFDGRGNYTMGIKEQIVFPELVVDKLDKVRGLDITFVTTAKTDDEGRALLRHLGMPFRKKTPAQA